jgi:hypothetical protein
LTLLWGVIVNLSEIRTSITDTVQEKSETLIDSVDIRINAALLEVAEEHDLSSLKRTFVATTVIGQAFCNFPAGFSGRLSYAGTADGQLKQFNGGIDEMILTYPTLAETGDLESIASEYPVLWYQKIPAVATLITCIGYALPSPLLLEDDIPTDIPAHLHEGLLVNKVLINYYNKIEDGVEGVKVNTNNYIMLYSIAHNLLLNWISRRRSNVGRSVWDA